MDSNLSTGSYRAEAFTGDVRYIAFAGALAVLLGAFGAHALKEVLGPDRLATFQTASLYHFIHVLAMLSVCCLANFTSLSAKRLRLANRCFAVGLVVFCGSVYILATRGLIGLESAGWIGAITPLGGVAFVAGWVALGLSFSKHQTA